jgi:mono/diheme cytochrome c family protein
MNACIRLAAVVALFALLALAGCGGQKSTTSTAGTAPGGSTPASGAPATTPGAVARASKFDSGPRAAESPADHEAAERGEKLFQVKACSACHAFGVKKSGPDLAGVTLRRTAAWIENQILHPDVMVKEDPIARELFAKHALQMPKQGLTQPEAKDVVEYLKAQDAKGASEKKEGSQ